MGSHAHYILHWHSEAVSSGYKEHTEMYQEHVLGVFMSEQSDYQNATFLAVVELLPEFMSAKRVMMQRIKNKPISLPYAVGLALKWEHLHCIAEAADMTLEDTAILIATRLSLGILRDLQNANEAVMSISAHMEDILQVCNVNQDGQTGNRTLH